MGKGLRERGRASKLDAFLQQIGKRPDEDIARAAGCSAANVYMYRRRHGIGMALAVPAAVVSPMASGVSERKPRPSALDRHRHLVGKLSDKEVAQIAGCTPSNVSAFRRKRGIAIASSDADAVPVPVASVAAAPVAVAPVAAASVAAALAPSVSKRKLRPSGLDNHRNIIGKLSDKEVAQIAGCTSSNVSFYRRKHGIPTAGPGMANAPAPVMPVASTPARRGRPPKAVPPVSAPIAEIPVAAPVVVAPIPAPVVRAPVAMAPVAASQAAAASPGYFYTVEIETDGQRRTRAVVAADLSVAVAVAVRAERNGVRVVAVHLQGTML